jgi:hypothetical protein
MTDVGLIFALIFVIIFSQAHGNTIKVNKLIPITGNAYFTVGINNAIETIKVERVKLLPRVVPLNTASMDVVHYAFCGIFGTRTVLVERLNVLRQYVSWLNICYRMYNHLRDDRCWIDFRFDFCYYFFTSPRKYDQSKQTNTYHVQECLKATKHMICSLTIVNTLPYGA